MSQPLYYLPGVTRKQLAPDGNLSRSMLEARGLAETFADVVGINVDCVVSDVTGTGPDGSSGCVLCYQTPAPADELPEKTGFAPEAQTWHKATDQLWIGLTNDSPPTPEDMRREKQSSGYPWTMGDGNAWTVPILRRPDESTELPTAMILRDDGTIDQPVKAAYRKLWEDAGQVVGYFYGDDPARELDKRFALELAIRAIGRNYRFGRHEQNLLQILDSESYMAACGIIVDTPKCLNIEEAEQKKSE
ncbi:MAG: hypothetical protein GY838_03920 [bacterium]|nr:hypothetical protein [bacterium]